jgi:surface polysaccharide O-acyltransferase-like enzyme
LAAADGQEGDHQPRQKTRADPAQRRPRRCFAEIDGNVAFDHVGRDSRSRTDITVKIFGRPVTFPRFAGSIQGSRMRPPPIPNRRHDLDALRAGAMLLGIGLHAALSFAPMPWLVQDSRQHDLFGLFFAAIHGFRMPLFFLLSGFFTAMLWRRRGLKALLQHRFKRVALPLLLGLVTIVPVTFVVSGVALHSRSQRAAATEASSGTAPSEPTPGGAALRGERLAQTGPPVEQQVQPGRTRAAGAGQRALANPLKHQAGGLPGLLMAVPVFLHLWFLWFLCWLVAGFAVCAKVAEWTGWKRLPNWLVVSPARFLWLIPLTMVPQWFMEDQGQGFGPGLSMGPLPVPQVLGYYAVFFAFGAFYHEADDGEGRTGRLWWAMLPTALLVLLPVGLVLSGEAISEGPPWIGAEWKRGIGVFFQVAYAWTMSFALMGLVRRLLVRENKTLRYLSDSAYWLYLAHLPLVVIGQLVVRDWPLPAGVKFAFVCLTVTGVLLLSYRFLVRRTWIGRLLNGPLPAPIRALARPDVES